MGKIFVIMGKTSSGKDSVFKNLQEHLTLNQGVWETPKTVVSYTTRPMRPGETEGVEYFFVTEERLKELREQGKVIEERCYHTVHGPWYYFTVLDGQMDLKQHDYLMINTLEGFEKLQGYYGSNKVIPLYIEADPKERLLRYIHRESQQKAPNYLEVCRRFLADEEDFSEAKLRCLGIGKKYLNQDLEECCREIQKDMETILGQSDTMTDSVI